MNYIVLVKYIDLFLFLPQKNKNCFLKVFSAETYGSPCVQ